MATTEISNDNIYTSYGTQTIDVFYLIPIGYNIHRIINRFRKKQHWNTFAVFKPETKMIAYIYVGF